MIDVEWAIDSPRGNTLFFLGVPLVHCCNLFCIR